jgi:Uma2 family endonuclease
MEDSTRFRQRPERLLQEEKYAIVPLRGTMANTQKSQPLIEEHNFDEFIDGKVIANPRPTSKHQHIVRRLGTWLDQFETKIDSPEGWWILPEVEILFYRNKLVPDLSGWRKEKQPQLPDNNPIEEIPEWVCEVISPGSRKADTQLKPPIYHKSKVAHRWQIDPEIRSLDVFRWTEAGWLLLETVSEDDKAKLEPFDSVELDLSLLWA